VPGVRFAVDAYVNFARQQPWQEAVCASLTELFAPQIHRQRLAGAKRKRHAGEHCPPAPHGREIGHSHPHDERAHFLLGTVPKDGCNRMVSAAFVRLELHIGMGL